MSTVLKMTRVSDGWQVRLRYGSAQQGRFVIRLLDEEQARSRAQQLQELARVLANAGKHAEAKVVLEKGAAVVTDREFREVERFAHDLCAGKIARPKTVSPTLEELGQQWTSGKLHEQYPDQIRAKRTADDDHQRLSDYVYPVIGDRPVESVTLDHCEEVMKSLPAKLSPLTRRAIGQTLVRLLAMAVYPLRLIERSPIPKGFLPKTPKAKALACLYPDEDRRLMACKAVPLAYRLLWGFLAREGMRQGEALNLCWSDLDLVRGAVKLDRNKTDDARAWALSPGVREALKTYRERYRANGEPSDLVFVSHLGVPFDPLDLAGALREHLRAIGLDNERPELFTSTDRRIMIRVHDLRGTFVTIALANGRSESWISDRTGHRSSQMIAKYKRPARTFDELQLGDLVPLDQAIPELSPKPEGCLTPDSPTRNSAIPRARSRRRMPYFPRTRAHKVTRVRIRKPQVSSSNLEVGSRKNAEFVIRPSNAGPPCGPPCKDARPFDVVTAVACDAIEAALAEAIQRASVAGEWATVERLVAELEGRRRERVSAVCRTGDPGRGVK